MPIQTKLQMKVFVEFSLSTLADRDALEAKVDTFIAGQPAGSYRVNCMRDDPSDPNTPVWFQTRLFIEATDISEVASARSAILANLDTMGTVVNFTLEMKEHLHNEPAE